MPIDNSKCDCYVWIVWGLKKPTRTDPLRMDLVAICSSDAKRDAYIDSANRQGYFRVETEKCLLDHLFGSKMLTLAQAKGMA